MGTSGFRPLVTAWEMTAWRFSFSSSISRRCSATSASIFAVSRSRKSMIAFCSYLGGMPTAIPFRISQLIARTMFENSVSEGLSVGLKGTTFKNAEGKSRLDDVILWF